MASSTQQAEPGMRPRDWLLLYLSLPDQVGEEHEVDPIRVQKGLFLFAMEGPIPNHEKYEFIPYNYGACSFPIYGDLDRLVDAGLVEKKQDTLNTWPRYRLTAMGREQAERIRQRASPRALRRLREIKVWILERSFVGLLKEIYRKYPRYAERSLLRL